MESRQKLRREFIELLRTDEEFRLAVRGLVGLDEILNRLESIEKRIEEHSKAIKTLSERVEELVVAIGELKVAVGSPGRRWGTDLERTVLRIYKHPLQERGIEPGEVQKFAYKDIDGRYCRKGTRLDLDVYIHDEKTYFIEVKPHAQLDDVEWFKEKSEIVKKILNREPEKLILVAVNLDRDAYERARELGIDTIYGGLIE
jgi:hypothetical protein